MVIYTKPQLKNKYKMEKVLLCEQGTFDSAYIGYIGKQKEVEILLGGKDSRSIIEGNSLH